MSYSAAVNWRIRFFDVWRNPIHTLSEIVFLYYTMKEEKKISLFFFLQSIGCKSANILIVH